MPPFIVYGVGNGLHLPLSMGMKVILMPKFEPAKFDEILLKHKPNYMAGVPSHYGYLLNSKNQEFLQNKEKLHSALKDLCIDGRNERDESSLFCKLNDAVSFFEKLIPYEKSGENQLIGEYNKVKGLVSKPLFTKLVVALGSLAQSGKAQAN